MAEAPLESHALRACVGANDWYEIAEMVYGTAIVETLAKSHHDPGLMVSMRRGEGEVLTAASWERVMGLKRPCRYTQQITHSVIDRRFPSGVTSREVQNTL